MDKIDTEIRFAGMAEERLRREDPHYRVWSFTDDDDVTALYLGRVDMNGEPVERYDRTRTILAFDGGRVFAKWHGGRLFEGGRLAEAWIDVLRRNRETNTLKALLDDGLDTLQELLEAIPQDSRQLSARSWCHGCARRWVRRRPAGNWSNKSGIWRNHDRLSRPAAARG